MSGYASQSFKMLCYTSKFCVRFVGVTWYYHTSSQGDALFVITLRDVVTGIISTRTDIITHHFGACRNTDAKGDTVFVMLLKRIIISTDFVTVR